MNTFDTYYIVCEEGYRSKKLVKHLSLSGTEILKDLGAKEVYKVSRSPKDTNISYDEAKQKLENIKIAIETVNENRWGTKFALWENVREHAKKNALLFIELVIGTHHPTHLIN